MKLTSTQFALIVGTLLLVAGGAYKMGQDSIAPMAQTAPTPTPQRWYWSGPLPVNSDATPALAAIPSPSPREDPFMACPILIIPPPAVKEGRILGVTPEEAARMKSYRVNCKDTPEAEGCDVLLRYIATRDRLKRKEIPQDKLEKLVSHCK